MVRGFSKNSGLYSRGVLLFGNWKNTIGGAGLNYQELKRKGRISRYPTKESVIREIKRRKEKDLPLNAKSLQTGQFKDNSLRERASRYFGSWQRAVEESGIDYRDIAKQLPSPYPTRQAVVAGIRQRKKKRLPINARAVERGEFKNASLYCQGVKF
ncbi:MAG: hypothetical protein WC334_06715, partial [Kiritimatiellales bacterium]